MKIGYFFVCLTLLSFSPSLAEENPLRTTTIAIITSEGSIDFTVEIADSKEEQERGLMYRTSLPKKHGMLFEFTTAEPISMWMKNTRISLDMIFIDNNNIITHIAPNTTPESTALISSQGAVHAVLELESGAAERYHIAEGDKVLYSAFP